MSRQSELTDEQIASYEDVFSIFDTNGDGTISAHELGTVLRKLGQNPTNKEIEEMITSADIDGNGNLGFDEFCRLMQDRDCYNAVDTEQQLRSAFRVFDRDGSKFIEADELHTIMTTLGEPLSNAEVKEMIKDADINGDGKIDYTEFVAMMTKK